ncbi:MAG: hypothetical protein KQJ78_20790 [Deltaproteobacteria bacterium]|nr:hypothetical protein [Deltaproteobacteria bacterium]
MERIKIGGIMESDGRALVRVMAVPGNPGAAGVLIGSLGEHGINIELLVESFDLDDAANFAMVIAPKDLDHALGLLEEVKLQIDAGGISYNPDVAILSVFGPHLREKPRVPGLMFTSLAQAGITPLAIATSISSVSCVVEGPHLSPARDALTQAFEIPFQVRQRPKDY